MTARRTPAPRLLGALILLVAFAVAAHAPGAQAAVSCPNGNPILQENSCSGSGSTGWQLDNADENVAGYATKTSFAKGENVPLKIARNQPTFPATQVSVTVYRLGYYGGAGGRLISSAGTSSVTVNNSFACNAPDTTTGKLDCGNWAVTYTIPGSALPTSGVYLAKLHTLDTNRDNSIVFVVRDDTRATPSKVEFVVPTATYQAYNTWGGKSLYFDRGTGQASGPNTISGNDRAVKVSFNRPIDNPEGSLNRFPNGPDAGLVSWLEEQGYDITYTDDYAVHANPAELKQHKVIALGAHPEYWSGEEMAAFKAARDAGVSILSMGGNVGYWKVRFEDGGRTLVCYKTVQGTGSTGSGTLGANDWGPDGVQGTADDALGADGIAGTADDHPENATTTFRDRGASPGDPNAPPAGRVGPDLPENSLLGSMYVGDNDTANYALTVPAADGNGQYAGDRIWRNTGIATNIATSMTTNGVGWEWDSVPTQAQYLAKQPAGVKKLSASPTTADTPNWLQDQGRVYATTPPPGQPGTVSAVKYKASSGAWVFAAGTCNWGLGLQEDPRIGQATYNMLSDMGVQPGAPSGITLDPAGSNQPPSATFTTASASPFALNVPVTFNASASSDADGTIVKYEWDLNGDGTFETSTGTTPTVTKTFTAEGTFDIRLRVTDNGGATDLTVRTYDVLGNRPPVASLSAAPNPAVVDQPVNFDAGASSDPDGTIAKVEWDLDGNGTYERNTGTTRTTTASYASAGTVSVTVRVTDNGGKIATATLPITVNSGGLSNYGDAVLDTPGLVSYWRMGETAGPAFADSKGTSNGTTLNGVGYGAVGAVAGDPNTALSFDGSDDAAHASVDLSQESTITVEFWMKWNSFSNNDALAMELTNDFNSNEGGFLIDPNAPQNGGTFGVGIGTGTSRNNAFFTRPSAGQWHHYAFVLDSIAPAATQITPYVDGQAVTYAKTASGTGAGTFANALLHFMSRNDSSLFGAGSLDEVAIYDRALAPSAINEHFQSYGTNRRPVARFTVSPSPARPNQSVTFNGSSSSDPDGTITRYQWDLDGNGTYETNSGTSPTVTKTYATAVGAVNVGLRVTDDGFGADTETHSLFVGDAPPSAALAATPSPSVVDQNVSFDASASTDDGSIAKYEWDLDGDGSFESDTGTTATNQHSYSAPGTVNVKVRVTDDAGQTTVKSLPLTVNSGGISSYSDAVQDTAGLSSYWRLGETSGTTLADSKNLHPATAGGGVTLGVPGAVQDDPNTAARFDGVDDAARANLDLSGTSQVTVEFWLKWAQYANNDALAMELTDNFNDNDGGFLVDPNAPQNGGSFGVGIGRGGSRNTVFFPRPAAGAWHHYAFVLDSTAPAAMQITPYVDGQPVAYTKGDSGTGAGPFTAGPLNLMSRAGSALFGKGDLDEVAIYDRALSAAAIGEHYSSYGTNHRPTASFTVSPNPVKVNQTVTFDASASSDPDGTITHYQWDLDGNGTYETETGSTPTVTRSYASASQLTVKLRVFDNANGTDTQSKALTVGNAPPTASLTASPNPATPGQQVQFDATGSTDGDGTIVKYEWDLDGDGTYEADTGTTKTATRTYSSTGTVQVGLRVTDEDGAAATATTSLSVKGASYTSTVLGTSGLLGYWRLGESAGTSLADASGGGHTATLTGGVLGVAGALAGDASTAIHFNGAGDSARVPLDLSGTQAVTVEFWLKWNAWANNDALAMEFTDNFNNGPGGFLIDPNSSDGRFGIGIGASGSRNTSYFERPSAGAWHHYALVLDAGAAGDAQIVPYVDGAPVTYVKGNTGTGAGPFSNATLYLMSRAGSALFGAGDLDEVAIYDHALSAAQISAHYGAGTP